MNIKYINGFKLIYIPNNSRSTKVQFMVKAGSFAETPKNTGISHLLEHVIIDSWTKCNKSCVNYWSSKCKIFGYFFISDLFLLANSLSP